jgi:ABC-type antimicrobial peptide transport system permease subunit
MSASIVQELFFARLMGGLVIGVIIAITLGIVALSAGSIANSIIISTDKNKKFIGLMRALGLKNRGVNMIIGIETFLQIFIGVLIAFLILLALQGVILTILSAAFGSVFGSIAMGVEFTVFFNMPYYIPAAVLAAFLGFALLMARGSLIRLGRADVISIMSEVA